MKRRGFIKGMGAGSLAVGALAGGMPAPRADSRYQWKLVTAWPKNFPGTGMGANRLASLIGEMSGGRIEVRVYAAGELVPPLEIFDAVARGTAEMGHGSAYYWKGKSEATQFFSSVPFGLTSQEMNAWIYYGGGLELWTELYARFGLIPAPAGRSGVQMGGWFKKEINSVEDLKGLKMRIPGLGAEVLARAGGTPVNLPGGEIFTALEHGAIDATEWVGPYNDLAFGLYQAAKYYYYPGWHEPGSLLEVIINKEAFESLPLDLQSIVMNACKVINQDILADYNAHDPVALQTLLAKHGVELRRFPDDVILRLKALSDEVVAEIAHKDEMASKIYSSFKKFMSQTKHWSAISELAYLQARELT
jgi:TRAP-type mannitol/chloroaromatic compound transport system substrate-binding protein